MATGSKLVIVESPTKAKKIGGYLGSEYTVMASVGHIRDLAQPSQVPAADKTKFGKFGVDVEDGFKPYFDCLIAMIQQVKTKLQRITDFNLKT